MTDDIVSLYQNGLSIRQIAETSLYSASKVRKILKNCGTAIRSSREGLCLRKQNNIPINNELTQRIEGELLGDGSVSRGIEQSHFIFNNSNHDYSYWLSKMFINGGINITGDRVRKNRYFHKYWKKWYTNYSFSTISTKQFHELESEWYTSRIKKLPEGVGLSPFSVLHWYMGDGTLPNGQYAVFCTDNFSKTEVELLSQKLNDIVNINSTAFKYEKYYRIFVPKTSVKRLLEYMGPPPFESIGYKWNLDRIGKINKEIHIDKDELYNLYIIQNLSRTKIAKIHSCSKSLIEKKLRLFNISKRKPNRVFNIDYNELYNLYINKKLSQKDLSRFFRCSVYTIRDNLIKYNIRKTKKWRK